MHNGMIGLVLVFDTDSHSMVDLIMDRHDGATTSGQKLLILWRELFVRPHYRLSGPGRKAFTTMVGLVIDWHDVALTSGQRLLSWMTYWHREEGSIPLPKQNCYFDFILYHTRAEWCTLSMGKPIFHENCHNMSPLKIIKLFASPKTKCDLLKPFHWYQAFHSIRNLSLLKKYNIWVFGLRLLLKGA